MTTAVDAEVEAYLAAVAGALADLPEPARAELLEDLADHLAEVRSECGDVPLRTCLGEPSDYAAELRAAAGHPALTRPTLRHSILERSERLTGRLRETDRALGQLVGATRATDGIRALQPGWWVLRGWILALVIVGAYRHAHWTGFVPHAGGAALNGWLLILAGVVVSVAVGRSVARRGVGLRVATGLASVVVAIVGILVARNVVGWDYQKYAGSGSSVMVVQPLAPSASPSASPSAAPAPAPPN